MFRAICMNPVFDMICFARQYSIKNRDFFGEIVMSAGGFGPNVARAVKLLGEEPECHLVTGGISGQFIREALATESIAFNDSRTATTSRLATHWLAGRSTRMLVSPSPHISLQILNDAFDGIASTMQASDVLLIGGSVQKEIESAYLERIAELCKKNHSCYCDIRTSRWKELAAANPYALKLPGSSNRASVKEATSLLRDALRAGGHLALCTIRPTHLLARTKRRVYQVIAPSVKVVNPYGAGDCLMATLAVSLNRGKRMSAALRTAMAAASASVQTPIPGYFEPREARRLAKQIRIISASAFEDS